MITRFCVLYMRIAMALVEWVDVETWNPSRFFGLCSFLVTAHDMHL